MFDFDEGSPNKIWKPMSQQFSSTTDTQQKEGRYIDPRLYPCMDSCSTIPGIPGPLANITGYSLQSLSSTWHCNKWKGGAGNLFLPYKLFEELCINWSCQGLYFLCYICIERFDFNTLLLKLSWFFFLGSWAAASPTAIFRHNSGLACQKRHVSKLLMFQTTLSFDESKSCKQMYKHASLN